MNIIPTAIPDVLILEPKVFKDDRGFFSVSYQQDFFQKELGIYTPFIQDNHSHSCQHVLRGLHYQTKHSQGKLVRIVTGSVFDVAVDLRAGSDTFGQWVSAHLSADNHRQMWIPPGFAHGFLVLSPVVDFLYKVTDIYAPAHEKTLAWNDPALAIDWPLTAEPLLSSKDQQGLSLAHVEPIDL